MHLLLRKTTILTIQLEIITKITYENMLETQFLTVISSGKIYRKITDKKI